MHILKPRVAGFCTPSLFYTPPPLEGCLGVEGVYEIWPPIFLARKRCIFWGPRRDIFQACGTKNAGNVLCRFFRLLGKSTSSRDTGQNVPKCDILQFLDTKISSTSYTPKSANKAVLGNIRTVSGLKRQLDKWHLFRASSTSLHNNDA